MEKPLLVLVNPAAGRSVSTTALGTVVSAFCAAGYCPTVYMTRGAGTASEMAETLSPGYERLLCLGGDGTLSDVIGGLMKLPPESRPRIGYIPMGTANDVATTLGLPHRQPGRAVGKILDGTPLDYDVGEMTGIGFFSYIAAFGAFTEVSYKTDQELKHALGHAAYVIEGLNALGTIKSYRARVEYDDGEVEGEFIYGALSNAMSVGGMVKMSKDVVNLSDGKFELLLIHKPTQPFDMNGIVRGILNRNYDEKGLTFIHSSKVRFVFEEPVPWTRDGEDGGVHKELELLCHKQAVQIMH